MSRPAAAAFALSGAWSPRPVLAALHRRQPLLAAMGWAALALTVLALVAMAIDPRTIGGVSVWTKPAKFAASFVLWFWTLAWAWGVLAPAARGGPTARIVLWGTVAAGGFELGWIILRGALGLPSHFAQDPLGAVMYGLMGLGAVTLVALAAVLGLLVLLRGDAAAQPRAWRHAVGLGLVLGGLLGGIGGATISVLGGPIIGAGSRLAGAGGLPPFLWSATAGDLRIAHFLGVHAMQALPALVLLLPRLPVAGVWLAGMAWAGLTAAAYAAALAGIPLMP